MRFVEIGIIGAGPAGLQAAYTLARANRSVGLWGTLPRRDWPVEGLIGWSGTSSSLQNFGLRQLDEVGVRFTEAVIDRIGHDKGMVVGDTRVERLILALGMQLVVPPIPGLREIVGKGLYFCPHCHGFEFVAGKWAYLSADQDERRISAQFRWWSPSLLFINPSELVKCEKISGRKVRLTLRDGRRVDVDALFAEGGYRHHELVDFLGLRRDEEGFVKTSGWKTSVKNVFAAGTMTGAGSVLEALNQGREAAIAVLGTI
jgi:thioredoxin reductase